MCDLFILSHSNFFQVQHMGCHQFFKCCCHVMSLSSRTLMLREISVLRSTFFSRWCSRMVTLLRQWTKLDQEHIIAQLQTNWFTGVMELQVIVHDFYMTMRVEFSSCLLLCKVVVILLMFWCVSKCIMHVYSSHTHTQPFNGLLSETTRVGQYQKKHSPTHTHPDHRTSFIIFLHLQWSMASSLFSLRAWQSSLTTSLQVLFGLHFSAFWLRWKCSRWQHVTVAAPLKPRQHGALQILYGIPLGLGPSTSYSMHFFTQ